MLRPSPEPASSIAATDGWRWQEREEEEEEEGEEEWEAWEGNEDKEWKKERKKEGVRIRGGWGEVQMWGKKGVKREKEKKGQLITLGSETVLEQI